jgi:peptide/nickel transport system permease protein
MALSTRESSSTSLQQPTAARAGARRWQTLRVLRRNPIGLVGVVIVIGVVVVALIGPAIWRVDYSDQIFRRLQPPSLQNPMGTDNLGRDVLARVIHGAQVSLQVAAIA